MIMKYKKLLVILILIISYIIINLIFQNNSYAIEQTLSTDINSIDSTQYPQIKETLQKLQKEHPNWKFKILYTDITWEEAIANEFVGHDASPRNLVPANNSNYDEKWICEICGKDKEYDNGSWRCASEAAIEYMMDPRNSLNNSDIFQFLELSYCECDAELIKNIVADTFLNNDSYIKAIIDASKTYNVDAFYIVARILQEQKKEGTVLCKGEGYKGQYIGYYNVFNIGANGNGKENVILNGLKKAQDYGWDTLEKSIIGGTEIIAQKYIAKGQNTLYLQKFDVDNSDDELYWHQYMQNILAAQVEGTTLRKTFEGLNNIEGTHTFIIPVFKNMPSTACPRPSIQNSDNPSKLDLVRVNVNNSLAIRDEAKKDANKIGSVYKDEIVTRIDKATEKVDGTYWDLIITSTGAKGYVARETFETEETYKLYLVPIVENENPVTTTPIDTPIDSNLIISNDKVKIEAEGNTAKIIPGLTTKELLENLGAEILIKNKNGTILNENDLIGTGCVINDTYTIIVPGDTSGDGIVDARDSLRILKYSVNTYNLENEFFKAGDLNNDGTIDARDSLRVLKYSVGTYEIKI